ncbi:MAG: CHC2 zinc finger domain-containing protein [Hydrogeniiclostridium mannosilyticum]
MVCCPFHADRNPSMKVDSRFHCFGCGVDGDVIDFTAKLFQLSLRQATEKLASDFGLSGTDDFSRIRYKLVEKSSNPKQLYKILCNYRSLLADWRITYAPQNQKIPASLLHRKHTLRRPCAVSAGHSLQEAHEKQQLLNGKEVTALGEAIERCKEAEEAA